MYACYGEDGRGQPPYDPKMMLAIILYANMLGITSSRKIERMLTDDIGFRYIADSMCPDHDTIADFRSRHCSQFGEIFRQCVQLAVRVDVVRMDHVAIDGTKVRANASHDAKQSKKQLNKQIRTIEKFVNDYLEEAERVDKEEDKRFGKGNNGYLLPEFLEDEDARKQWIKDQLREMKEAEDKASEDAEPQDEPKGSKKTDKLQKRLKKLETAKAALEQKEKQRKAGDPTGKRQRDNERKRGTPFIPKINVTDPDARTMRFGRGGYAEGYNCQIAVDEELGIIVATMVTQEANDSRQLEPVLLQTEINTGGLPYNVTADASYFNVDQIENPHFEAIEFFIPPKAKGPHEQKATKSEQMRAQLKTQLGKVAYAARKGVVEPVFGAIKHARGVRQMAMRGLEKVQAEWQLTCTVHNLLKLYKRGLTPA
jgi:transposase